MNKSTSAIGLIGFRKHKIHCIIGVNPEERINKQDLIVDLQVKADFASCSECDDFEKTVDYVKLTEICTQLAIEGKFQLIESYAHTVLQHVISQLGVLSATIRVEKPQAIPTADCSFVELELVK